MGLAAIAAAKKWNDHPHTVFRQFENMCQLLLHAGGILRGGVNHQFAARLPIGGSRMGLYMTVLHRRQGISILEDLFGFLKTFLDVAVSDSEYAAHVAAQLEIEFLAVHACVGLIALLVQHRRARLGGFEKIEYCRQFLVVYLDQIQRLFSNLAALRSYERDDFTDMAHTIRSHYGLIIDHRSEIRI